MRGGFVSLVGAGPGDPGLLTIKALERIRQADLIIYDTLANPEHLRQARPGVHRVCVGRGFRYKKWSQKKINRLILEAAGRGEKVVRLKGGDPYLFGRGGEEALFLVEHHVPFEVVPGVTSATGCAAYAGIPLTHRDHNASVTFLTGHRAHDENLDTIDWRKIVSLQGTLVIYMGFYHLKKIAERLIGYGMDATTPVAVVEWATLPWQKSCDGPLHKIAEIVKKNSLRAPCIIVIGAVVKLRDRLNWFEKLPLFGRRILVMRPAEKISALTDKFRTLGAWVIECPTIEIRKTPDFKALDRALRQLSKYDWILFTSTYGVEAFFERLEKNHGKDARALSTAQVASVGSETSACLLKRGIHPDLEPSAFETAALIEALKKRGPLNGKRLLLPRTNIAPKELERELKRLGAIPDRVTAYRTASVKASKNSICALIETPMDFVVFTSSSSVNHFVNSLGLARAKIMAKKSCFASIGPVTSRTLREHGLRPACQAKIYNIDGLVDAVRKYAQKKR
jgi:uroporphyrinogen III methyltransferase/synthase